MSEHSTEIAARQLRELTDPQLIRAALLFLAALSFVDAAQWPIETHDTTGSTGKPGSRPPGRVMFASHRRRLVNLAEDADETKSYVVNALAKVRETRVVSVGGVPMPEGVEAAVQRIRPRRVTPETLKAQAVNRVRGVS